MSPNRRLATDSEILAETAVERRAAWWFANLGKLSATAVLAIIVAAGGWWIYWYSTTIYKTEHETQVAERESAIKNFGEMTKAAKESVVELKKANRTNSRMVDAFERTSKMFENSAERQEAKLDTLIERHDEIIRQQTVITKALTVGPVHTAPMPQDGG